MTAYNQSSASSTSSSRSFSSTANNDTASQSRSAKHQGLEGGSKGDTPTKTITGNPSRVLDDRRTDVRTSSNSNSNSNSGVRASSFFTFQTRNGTFVTPRQLKSLPLTHGANGSFSEFSSDRTLRTPGAPRMEDVPLPEVEPMYASVGAREK